MRRTRWPLHHRPKERPYTPGSRAQELKEGAKKDPRDYSKWLAKASLAPLC